MERLLSRLPTFQRSQVRCRSCGASYDERPRNCHACGGQDFTPNP